MTDMTDNVAAHRPDHVFTFSTRLAADVDDVGRVSARLVPFGEPVPYGGKTIRFRAGSIAMPNRPVALTVDHGTSVLDRIGVLSGYTESDGAYGSFDFADVAKAQDVRELIRAGALTDVSVGIADWDVSDDGVMTGTLDHVSIVTHGRFGSASQPSRVLAVHDNREREQAIDMDADTNAADTVAPIQQFDGAAFTQEVAALRAQIADVASAIHDTPAEFTEPNAITVAMLDAAIDGARRRRADFALADVVGDLGTADASGLSPDWYWSAGLQANIDRRRPLFAAAGSTPFPAYGNALTSARVTQDVAVGSGKAQKAETATQALQVIGTSFPVVFHSGAVDVALELISQSSPAVTQVLRNSFLKEYAKATNADAAAKAEAAATATGAALDVATYGGLVTDLITTSNLIEDATGIPGDYCGVTPAQWVSILSLMDGGDRRQFAITNPRDADGSARLTVRAIDVGGVWVFRDPDLTVAVQFNQETLSTGEKAPEMVQATNVPNMGIDMGIIGATVVEHWAAGLYKYSL